MQTIGTIILFLCGSICASAADSLTTIPFRIYRDLIVFQGSVAGQAGLLILDTGTTDLVLNAAYFPQCSSVMSKPVLSTIQGPIASQCELRTSLETGTSSFPARAQVIDLQPIAKAKRMNLLGMVGLRVFNEYELEIDFKEQCIRLLPLDRSEQPKVGYRDYPPTIVLSTCFREGIPCLQGQLLGRRLWLGLDTGVAVNILPDRWADRLSASDHLPTTMPAIDISGQYREATLVQISGWRIGELDLPALKTALLPATTWHSLASSGLDGILGLAFFRHFQRVALNGRHKTLKLWSYDRPESILAGNR